MNGDRQKKMNVIETGWTYGSAAPAETAPEPSPSAPGAAPEAPAEQNPQAQNTPSAGTTVSVRMIDAVDSSSDPAGKQYHATVTKPVNAGNNVLIEQGSDATMTLARNGSAWVAELTSLVINGQSVAVTSSPANVTGGAQNAMAGAANAVGSVLRGFGRRANPAPAAGAVATGARVVLPPGTNLSFVLGATPSTSAEPPVLAAAAPGTTAPAPAQTPDKGLRYVCEANYANQTTHQMQAFYRTNAFQAPTDPDTQGKVRTAWMYYLVRTYPDRFDMVHYFTAWCQNLSPAQSYDFYYDRIEAKAKVMHAEVVRTGWQYTPGDENAVPSSAAPDTSGLFKGYCFSDPDQRVVYLTDIFPTNIAVKRSTSIRDTGPIRDAFLGYLKQKYAYKSSSNYPVSCGLNSSPYIEASRQDLEAGWRRGNKQIVATDWKYTARPDPVATTAASAPALPSGVDPQLAQDPRLAQLSPEYRQFALSEMPRSKDYCQNNTAISSLMDCSCFAKIVLDYRIAHAGETVGVAGGRRTEPLINVIGKLDCSKCVPPDKIRACVGYKLCPP
jgi:hypothetical protein